MKKLAGILAGTMLIAMFVGFVYTQEPEGEIMEEETVFRCPGMGMGRGAGMPGMMGRGRGMTRHGQRGRMGPGPRRGLAGFMMMGQMGIMEHLADEIDLSEDQKDEIHGIMIEHRKEMIRKKADRELAKVELQEILSKDNPDMTSIEDQIREQAMIEADMKYSRIKVMVDIKNVLSEEQHEKLKELMKNRPRGPRGNDNPPTGRGRRGRGGRWANPPKPDDR
ncbi:hypothetical protein GF312_02520 [Candidatus Poribacteria bacterium]|nr:hypothetical protein [Candidatus Poribacteria bacterium]